MFECIRSLMGCHAKEENHQNLWLLDTGYNNHMCSENFAFFELDESFWNVVKFEDNYTISIIGKGNVSIWTKENYFHIISNVFFIPNWKRICLVLSNFKRRDIRSSLKKVFVKFKIQIKA